MSKHHKRQHQQPEQQAPAPAPELKPELSDLPQPSKFETVIATTGMNAPPLAISEEVKAVEAKLAEEKAEQQRIIAKYGNKSEAIRALLALGHKTAEVAKMVGVRYQHVYNVNERPLKRKLKEEREVVQKALDNAVDKLVANANANKGKEHNA